MKKTSFILSFLLLLFVTLFGQIPPNYYSAANGKKQTELKITLSEIITNGYVQRTYKELWTDFQTTDMRPDGKVWDIYSNCTFTFGVDQDSGSGGTSECEKYNREHSVPNSWFGGTVYPMYTDLFHLYPTDKYVNGQRDNFPYGETNSTLMYGNGSKKGAGSSEFGYLGIVFEPTDEYKGDLARTYFYMATRYLNTNFGQKDQGDVVFSYNSSTCNLTSYAVSLFLKWHRNDPVSEKEINRNNAIYGIQKNRNPYIDYPELVEHIWGELQELPFELNVSVNQYVSNIKITRCYTGICIEGVLPDTKIELYSIIGQKIFTVSTHQNYISFETLKQGVYIVKIAEHTEKIVW